MLAATAAGGAQLGRHGYAVRAEVLLGAGAPERRGFDRVPVNGLISLRNGSRPGKYMPLWRSFAQCDGRDVTRGQWIHTQFTFIPAAFMIARFTAVRAIWTL